MTEKLQSIKKKLKKELDKERYQHTLGVMYTASCLAMAYGTDTEQAMFAGLLHDCAKCIPNSDKVKLCEKNHLYMSDVEKENPFFTPCETGGVSGKIKIRSRRCGHTSCHFRTHYRGSGYEPVR